MANEIMETELVMEPLGERDVKKKPRICQLPRCNTRIVFSIWLSNEFHKGVLYFEFGMSKIGFSEKFDYRFHSTNRFSHLRNQFKVIDN